MSASRSARRLRSVSELKLREHVKGEVDQNVIQPSAAYLTSMVDNPGNLAVHASYWHELAEIVAAADCLQNVRRVRLVKIAEQIVGFVADMSLEQS